MDLEAEGAFPSFFFAVEVEGVGSAEEEVLGRGIEGGTAWGSTRIIQGEEEEGTEGGRGARGGGEEEDPAG